MLINKMRQIQLKIYISFKISTSKLQVTKIKAVTHMPVGDTQTSRNASACVCTPERNIVTHISHYLSFRKTKVLKVARLCDPTAALVRLGL